MRIAAMFLFVILILTGCSTFGRLDTSSSNFMTRTDRGRLPSGWQVDCLIEESTATQECFAGKYGTDGQGRKKVPFVVAFRQIVAGGWFLGPTVEPGIHTSLDRIPTVSVDGNPLISDMSSDVLIAQLLAGSLARGRYQFWPSDPAEMEVDLEGFPEAYELLQSKIESVASLYGRTGTAARTMSASDKNRTVSSLVDQYGEDALIEANHRAERMLNVGNLKGHDIWRQVMESLEGLSEPEPTPIKVDL